MTTSNPKVAVLILNWNRAEMTIACIESLLHLNYDNYDIIVIDNGSTDGSEEIIRHKFPNISILQTGSNLGYSEGNNRGIKKALEENADYILILNNDTKLDRDCLSHLVEMCEKNESIGVAGAIACDYDDPAKILQVSCSFDWQTLKPKILNLEEANQFDRGNYFDAAYIQGDCMFVRKQVFKKIGYFNTRFFFGYEDVDFCFRAAAAGYRCVVSKCAKFYALINGTIGRGNPLFAYYMTRNRLLFLSRLLSKNEQQKYFWPIIKTLKWDIFDFHFALFAKSENMSSFKGMMAMLLGCFDFLRGRFGQAKLPSWLLSTAKMKDKSSLKRIGIDARTLNTDKRTGVQNYILYLVKEMAVLQKDVTFYLFYPAFFKKEDRILKSDLNFQNVKFIKIPLWNELSNKRFNFFWFDVLLPLYSWWLRLNMFHTPAGEILPRYLKCKKILTVHHLWEGELERKDPDTLKRMKESVLSADRMITCSEASKKTIATMWHLDESNFSVIYNGFMNHVKDTSSLSVKKEGFILFVGSHYKRKNILGLLRAYLILRQQKNISHKLLLAGKEVSSESRDYVVKHGLSNHVLFLSHVTDEELDRLYRQAQVFVFPSFEEGFGMPILEALSRGTSVVASDIPVFHEILADAGFYADPHSPEDIARAIWDVLTKIDLVTEKSKIAPSIVKEFTWAKAALQTWDVYTSYPTKTKVLYMEKGLGKGGSALSLKYLLDGLEKGRYHATVLFNCAQADPAIFSGNGIDILMHPESKFMINDQPKNAFVAYIFSLVGFFERILPSMIEIAKVIKEKKIDLVHLNNDIDSHIAGILASKMTGTPFICHLRSTRSMTKTERFFSKFVDHFIALSEEGRDFYVNQGLPKQKILVSYDPFKTEGPSEYAEPIWIHEVNGKKKVGILSRLAKGKGHDVFLDAAKQVVQTIPDTHFFIMGVEAANASGYQKILERQVIELGLSQHVTFTGWQSDIMSALQNLDVVVDVSSLPEGLRRTIVEAMLAEKPVVASDVGQTRDILKNSQGGFIVPCNSPEDLSEKIILLLQDDALRLKMGKSGRKYASEKYNMEEKAKEIENLYQTVLSKNGK